MKHFLSRSLSLLLVFALCLTIFPVTSLASEANTAEEKAQALYELGLFYGKGSNSDGTPNFALQDSATRNEAATMLIRLMGQESKAKSQLVAGTISNPFTDVPDWAKSNVAWLYENNYVNGTSAKIYSGSQAVTAQQFAALLLRSLGYSEKAGDFSYANALSYAASCGLLASAHEASYAASFRRAEMADMCYNALSLKMKGSSHTLQEVLTQKGIFSKRNNSGLSSAKALKLTRKYANGGKDNKYYVQEATTASPTVADINGDGKKEVIFSARSIFCLNGSTGATLWGVNSGKDRATARSSSGDFGRASGQVYVQDVDGDGKQEILTVHTNYGSGKSLIALYNNQGYFKPGWPITTQKPVYALTVSDMDGDGTSEICIGLGVGASKDPSLYIYEPNGQLRAGWPQVCDYGLYSDSMMTVDLDRDGQKELVLLFDDQFVRAYNLDGSDVMASGGVYQGLPWKGLPICENYSFETTCAEYARSHNGICFAIGLAQINTANKTREERYILSGTHGGIVAADLDGNGTVELACTGMIVDGAKIMIDNSNSYEGSAKYFPPFILNLDRTRYINFSKGFDWTQIPTDTGSIVTLNTSILATPNNTPVVADVDGDGNKEILYTANDAKVHCWNLDGTEHGAWPYSLVKRSSSGYAFASKPAVGDVNSDGKPEVIFTSYTQLKQNAYKGSLYVLDGTGKPLATVALPAPLSSSVKEANGCMAQPTVADVDNDGKLEIVLSTIYSGIVVYDIA